MTVYTFNSDYPYGANMYVLEANGEYAIIDPSASYQSVKKTLFLQTQKIKFILLTHGHFDHFLFLDSWCERTGLKPSVSYKDSLLLINSELNCYKQFTGQDKTYDKDVNILGISDVLKLGSRDIKVISLPGHTAGSLGFLTDEALFAGDTVFANGGVGRTDLPTGSFSQLLESIEKIRSLDKSLTVYSGHGYTTQISKI